MGIGWAAGIKGAHTDIWAIELYCLHNYTFSLQGQKRESKLKNLNLKNSILIPLPLKVETLVLISRFSPSLSQSHFSSSLALESRSTVTSLTFALRLAGSAQVGSCFALCLSRSHTTIPLKP